MVKLKAIQVAGFQSWKNCTINFADGLNVITAPNNTGKSVFFKCIQLVGHPNSFTKEEKESMIRKDCERASALFLFTDGSAALVFIYVKGNIYLYADKFDGNKTNWNSKSFTPPSKLISNLGLIIEPSNGFIANMLSLKHDLFLIESDSKANNDLIKALTQNDQLTRLCETFREKLPEVDKKYGETTEIVYMYQKALESYEYVDISSLEDDVNEYEMYLGIFESVAYIFRELEDLASIESPRINLRTCVDILEITNLFEDLNEYLELDKNKIKEDLNTIETIIILNDIKDSINEIVINETIEDAQMNLKMFDLLSATIQINNSLAEYSNRMEYYKRTSCYLDEFKFILDCYSSITELNNLVNDFNLSINEYEKCNDDCNKIKERLEHLKSEFKTYDCPIHGKIILTKDNMCVPAIEE